MTRADGVDQHRIHPRISTLLAALALVGLASATAVAAPMGKMARASASVPPNMIAPNEPFIIDGKSAELKTYLGHPVIVWQVATWCPSCKAGLKTFARHQTEIDRSDMTILVLRDYKNGGYPGPSMDDFVKQAAPTLLHDPHFVIGKDTKALFDRYNPHHFIDIYQVIARDGRIAVISSAPSATFGKIRTFIRPKAGP